MKSAPLKLPPGTTEHDVRADEPGRRILRGIGANAFGQMITLGTQLLSLPIFLHNWSLTQYGVWLIISAIPAYFSLADVGVGTVAMNRMTMFMAQGKATEADRCFQSALALTTIATLLFLGAALSIVWSFDMGPIRDANSRATISILITVALLGTFTPLVDGIFRSASQFATGTIAINLIRATEWLGGVLGLVMEGSMVAVATGLLLGRIIPSLILIFWTRRTFPHIHWSFSGARANDVREMLPAASAFLALPMGNAVLLQGMTIVVGIAFGPAVVAVFNSCRTLSRVPVQLLTMCSRSLWPELSRSYGAGDVVTLNRLYRHTARWALVGSAVACAILYAASPLVLRIWSHGLIEFDPLLLGLFCLTAFVGCAWQVDQVLLSATNTHVGISAWYFSLATAAVVLAAMLPRSAGLGAVIGATLLFELFMLVVARRAVALPLQRHTA